MKKRVLVVVDYQNDFVVGSLKSDNALAIKDKVEAKIYEYINNGDEILFTLDIHDGDYLYTREGKNLPVIHCQDNEKGSNLAIDLSINDLFSFYVKKDRFGLDSSTLTDLYNYLYIQNEGLELEDIEFTIIGVATNICVLSVAVSLQNTFNNSDIYIDAECCASYDNELHEKALDVMEGLQFKVINRRK